MSFYSSFLISFFSFFHYFLLCILFSGWKEGHWLGRNWRLSNNFTKSSWGRNFYNLLPFFKFFNFHISRFQFFFFQFLNCLLFVRTNKIIRVVTFHIFYRFDSRRYFTVFIHAPELWLSYLLANIRTISQFSS